MSGIRSDLGMDLLNALTCNGVEMYNKAGITSKPINYIEYDSSGSGSTSHIQEVFFQYNYTNIFTDIINQSYIGLLAEEPIYHMGGGSVAHPALSLKNIEKGETTYTTKNFLNIHEVPNHNHGGILGSSEYWPEYSRALLGKLIYNSETKAYYPGQSNMSGATITTTYELVNEKAVPTHQLINSNNKGLFLGQNTIATDWPAIKYFGLFKKNTDENNNYIYTPSDGTTYYYIESEPDLYFWGELSENKNWYHLTDDTSYNENHIYYTKSGTEEDPIFTLWTSGSTGWVAANMYEKKGIIIHQSESAAFSAQAFKLIFENATYFKEHQEVV